MQSVYLETIHRRLHVGHYTEEFPSLFFETESTWRMIVRFDHGIIITTGLGIGVQPQNQDQLELCIFLQDRVGLQSSQMHHQRDDAGFDDKVLVSQPVSQD